MRRALCVSQLWLLLWFAPAAGETFSPDVASIIAAARGWVGQMTDDRARTALMFEVARAQALSGDAQGAAGTLEQARSLLEAVRFDDDRAKETLLGRAAVANAAVGDDDAATFLSGAILNDTLQALALRDIAADAANLGAVEDARMWIARIDDPSRRVDALDIVARGRLAAHDRAGALVLIKDALSASLTLREGVDADPNAAVAFALATSIVARLQGRAGHPEAAEATATAIDPLLEGMTNETGRGILAAYGARAHAAGGPGTVALAMARDGLALAEKLDDADLILILVLAQAEAGDAAGALENVDRRVGTVRRMAALAGIARARADAGDVPGAMTTAALIAEGDVSRIQAHVDIALAAGPGKAATAALDIAVAAAERSRAAYDLQLVATALARVGDRDGALRAILRIDDPQARMQGLGDVLSVLASAG